MSLEVGAMQLCMQVRVNGRKGLLETVVEVKDRTVLILKRQYRAATMS